MANLKEIFCSECEGTGWIVYVHYENGKKLDYEDRCWKCDGTGLKEKLMKKEEETHEISTLR